MFSRVCAAAAVALSLAILPSSAGARPHHRVVSARPPEPSNRVAFTARLHDGRLATVYTDGRTMLSAPPHQFGTKTTALKRARSAVSAPAAPPARMLRWLSLERYGPLDGQVPDFVRRQIVFDLEHPPQRFAPERVLVAFAPSVSVARDSDALAPAATRELQRAILARRPLTPHAFTSDARTNAALAKIGVDRVDRLFGHLDRGTLGSLRARAEARTRDALLPFENAFALHVAGASVEAAVRKLRALPGVAYVSPDYTVQSMIADRRPVPAEALREIAGFRRSTHAFGRAIGSTARSGANSFAAQQLPTNTAIAFDLQAMLNAPGVDAVAAFDEIGARFNQLPGTGTIITNVGLGDADDASALADPNDPCNFAVTYGGPTTHMIGGQRYLDLPSLPLIPVWVADAHGNLSPTAEVCNVDPQLGEVGLDFSVMAPLPDNLQRPGETAQFGMDLLGIAPGASYRWVAPGGSNGIVTTSDTLAAMVGAARQQPAPDVITASIGFGIDVYGFPGRYLEDDPLAQSIIAGIVASNVVVCIAANDGTRTFTSAAIGPSGGSAPTNVGAAGATTVDDIGFTTEPSVIPDSGAIDVGSTTLDDIASANPQDPALASLANVKAFPETRFNGTLGFSSGFGSRVNVSAPGDNVNALSLLGGKYDAVGLGNVGGTSASAPEVAAVAAIALQVARLTGHPFASASQVRDLLVATGTPVANPPQSDVPLHVGSQVSARRVVEQLLAAAGKPVQPGIARVAVQGRRSGAFIASAGTRYLHDAVFVSALDPSYIRLDGPFARIGNAFAGTDTAADLNSYITLAPDWEGIPANATYRLTVAGQPSRVVATTPYARLLPAQLFAAAGVPLTPGVSRTLSLTYRASSGLHVLAETTFQLTFGPPAASSRLVLAPRVPPVVSGAAIPVSYDLGGYPAALLGNPTLEVSLPGEATTPFFNVGLSPYYSVPLTSRSGTVNVPVSALAGAGTYTLGINLNSGVRTSDVTDLAFTRVDTGTARPAAPLLSGTRGGATSRTIELPYKSPFTVTYDVSAVPGASGAIVEIAAPAPGPNFFTWPLRTGFNTFRNPNGSELDDDGAISGSIYSVRASGATGSVAIDPVAAGIPATATVNVRVLASNGSGVLAEASDAGTVRYDGINSDFGLPLSDLYINPNGSDGYLVEFGGVGSPAKGSAFYPVEPFDLQQGTVAPTSIAFTTLNHDTYPIVQNDLAVAVDAPDPTTLNYFRASPVSAPFGQFSFPPGSFTGTAFVLGVGLNSTPTRSAYIAQDVLTGAFTVTRGDVSTATGFAPGIDVTAQLGPNFDYAGLKTFAYDPGPDRAYMLVEDSSLTCDQQSPQLLTVDFATGTASIRTLAIGGGVLQGQGYGLALDPTTHLAAIATGCQIAQPNLGHDRFTSELTLLDLSSGTTSRVFQHVIGMEQEFHGFPSLLGGDSPTIGIDAVNHLILQRSMWCPALIGTFDFNARVCLNEYDETGRLVKTIPGLFDSGLDDPSSLFNGVNGTTRTGVAMGQQIYSIYILSTSVQPYSY
jgi:Subtilase family